MGLNKLSASEWEEFLANPITQAVRDALQSMLDRQQRSAEQAYWPGRAWPETERQSLVRLAAWHSDFFDASFDDMKAAIEATDEHKRNTPAGI